ncbi:MAG TPA: hypothetical protein VIL12_01935 [Acidimicrobiia bacterium]
MATVAWVAGAGLALVFLVMLAWALVVQYGLGVVRGALDEGARAGSLAGGQAEVCETVARDALANLLGGPVGDRLTVRCVTMDARLVAEAEGVFGAWLPGFPDWSFRLRAATTVES